MRISDWSSDVCSSDLNVALDGHAVGEGAAAACRRRAAEESARPLCRCDRLESRIGNPRRSGRSPGVPIAIGPAPVRRYAARLAARSRYCPARNPSDPGKERTMIRAVRSEEHTSELQSLMRISYAVFCLKTKQTTPK